MEQTKNKFFSIHLLSAIYEMQNSIIVGNIENTTEKINLALKYYPTENYYYEYHNSKINMDWIIKNY